MDLSSESNYLSSEDLPLLLTGYMVSERTIIDILLGAATPSVQLEHTNLPRNPTLREVNAYIWIICCRTNAR